MSTWKNVGMTYLKYADLCATHVRNALKEPMKTKSAAMSDMHIRIMQWEGGKRGKPGAHQLLPTCWQAVFLPVLLAPSLVACAVLERAHWARPAILQAAPVCGPDTRQLSPSPPFGGARKRSAPAALTLCARPFAFAFAARRDRDQDGCSVILVATARSYFCGAHRCSCGGALRSARHILLSGAAAGVCWTPLALALRWVVGVCSRVFPHTQAVGPVGLRVVGKNIFRKNLRAASHGLEEPPPPGGGAATLQRRGRAGQRDGADGSRLFCFSP
jgi:F-type H+-transporting ATPase subunit epsilon